MNNTTLSISIDLSNMKQLELISKITALCNEVGASVQLGTASVTPTEAKSVATSKPKTSDPNRFHDVTVELTLTEDGKVSYPRQFVPSVKAILASKMYGYGFVPNGNGWELKDAKTKTAITKASKELIKKLEGKLTCTASEWQTRAEKYQR